MQQRSLPTHILLRDNLSRDDLLKLVRYVLVCQNRTCLQQGSQVVLQAFQAQRLEGWEIIAASCMGYCGNGPMVRVLPDDVLYCRVQPEEVTAVVEKHLLHGHPIQAMLYRPHTH